MHWYGMGTGIPLAWGHTRLLETDWRLITQESHVFIRVECQYLTQRLKRELNSRRLKEKKTPHAVSFFMVWCTLRALQFSLASLIIQHRFALNNGGGEGNRTPVREYRHISFSERSYLRNCLL